MKKETIKYIIQLIVAILTAIGTTLGVTSCMKKKSPPQLKPTPYLPKGGCFDTLSNGEESVYTLNNPENLNLYDEPQ